MKTIKKTTRLFSPFIVDTVLALFVVTGVFTVFLATCEVGTENNHYRTEQSI